MTVSEQVRAIALLLPEAEERTTGDGVSFIVDGKSFATLSGETPVTLRVRDDSGETSLALDPDVDWTLVEDRIAQSWQLTAPRRLLEAGGR